MSLIQFPRKYSFPRLPLGGASISGPFLMHPIPTISDKHIISGTLSGIYEWCVMGAGISILQMIPLIPPDMPTGYELTAFGAGGSPFFSGPLSNCFVSQAQGTISQGDTISDYWADIWAVNTSGEVVFRYYVDTDWYSFSILEYGGNILYSPAASEGGFACLDPATREILWEWFPPSDYVFPGNESSEPAYPGGVNAFDVIRHGPHAGDIVVADSYIPGFYTFHPEQGITWAVGGSQAYSFGPNINNVHDFYNPWGVIHTPQDTLILVDNSNGNWREVDWQCNILNYVSWWDPAEENPTFFPESSVSLDGSSFISAGDSLDKMHGLIFGNWEGDQKYFQMPFVVNRSQLSVLEEPFLVRPPAPTIHVPNYPMKSLYVTGYNHSWESGYVDMEMKKYTADGMELVWSFLLENPNISPAGADRCYGVAVAPAGDIYCGTVGLGWLWKIDPTGAEMWHMIPHTDCIPAIAVDQSGCVYTASFDGTIKKHTDQGDLVWSFTNHTDSIIDVSVDQSGYVYTASLDGSVRKITPMGSEVWQFTEHEGPVICVAVDQSGYVYSGGYTDNAIRKISPTGSQEWVKADHTQAVNMIVVNSLGYIYTISDDGYIYLRNPAGEILAGYKHPAGVQVYSVAVSSSDDYVYTGGSDGVLRKLTDGLSLKGEVRVLMEGDYSTQIINRIAFGLK